MKPIFLVMVLILSLHAVRAQTTLNGKWEGEIRVGGKTIGIEVLFRDSSGFLNGTIDVPQQGARGLSLKNVVAAGSIVHFELPTGMSNASFDGTLEADSITGIFSQGMARGTFSLVPTAVAASRRAPEPLPPYLQNDVTFKDSDITLAGTLTVPPTAGRHPAVVLLTGSGAEDRDENIFGFKVFKVIADRLTRDGIAVLRFDDRGVGGSSGSQTDCTTEDYAGDAIAGVRLLRADVRIDAGHIGILGHSEGALAASIAASQDPSEIAAVVLLAGPGLKGDSLIRSQIVALAHNSGESDETIRKNLSLQNTVYEAIRTGADLVDVRSKLSAAMARSFHAMSAEDRRAIGDSAAFVASSVERTLAGAQSRWFRRFIDLDPVAYLQRLQCPVLALFGERDQQVYPALNMPPVQTALSRNKDATLTVIPGVNHLFQLTQTGSPAEYGNLPKEFAPGVLDTISGWLQKRMLGQN